VSGELNCSNSTFDCGMRPVGGQDLPTSCDAADPRVSVDIDSGRRRLDALAANQRKSSESYPQPQTPGRKANRVDGP
jgi:hypothetical protein